MKKYIQTTFNGSFDPQKHYVSRREFEERFGVTTNPDVIGVCFCSWSGFVIEEFVFTDELLPFGKYAQLNELERLYKL